MNKSELIYRRITYSLFIILFLIVTPLIIFYTQGYRFNFKNQHIQQTGILVISSNPKRLILPSTINILKKTHLLV